MQCFLFESTLNNEEQHKELSYEKKGVTKNNWGKSKL